MGKIHIQYVDTLEYSTRWRKVVMDVPKWYFAVFDSSICLLRIAFQPRNDQSEDERHSPFQLHSVHQALVICLVFVHLVCFVRAALKSRRSRAL